MVGHSQQSCTEGCKRLTDEDDDDKDYDGEKDGDETVKRRLQGTMKDVSYIKMWRSLPKQWLINMYTFQM